MKSNFIKFIIIFYFILINISLADDLKLEIINVVQLDKTPNLVIKISNDKTIKHSINLLEIDNIIKDCDVIDINKNKEWYNVEFTPDGSDRHLSSFILNSKNEIIILTQLPPCKLFYQSDFKEIIKFDHPKLVDNNYFYEISRVDFGVIKFEKKNQSPPQEDNDQKGTDKPSSPSDKNPLEIKPE